MNPACGHGHASRKPALNAFSITFGDRLPGDENR
jgi:hypothetical protein